MTEKEILNGLEESLISEFEYFKEIVSDSSEDLEWFKHNLKWIRKIMKHYLHAVNEIPTFLAIQELKKEET